MEQDPDNVALRFSSLEELLDFYESSSTIPDVLLLELGYVRIVEGVVIRLLRQERAVSYLGKIAHTDTGVEIETAPDEVQRAPSTPAPTAEVQTPEQLLKHAADTCVALFARGSGEESDDILVTAQSRVYTVAFPAPQHVLFDFNGQALDALSRQPGTREERIRKLFIAPRSSDRLRRARETLEQIAKHFGDEEMLDATFMSAFSRFTIKEVPQDFISEAIVIHHRHRLRHKQTVFRLHMAALPWISLLRHNGFGDIAEQLGDARAIPGVRTILHDARQTSRIALSYDARREELHNKRRSLGPVEFRRQSVGLIAERRKRLGAIYKAEEYFNFPRLYAMEVHRAVRDLVSLLDHARVIK